MNTPILSICIATYNRGRFIAETLDSVLNQLEPCVELIVVDGASPDNTAQVMAGYVSRYAGLRYFRESENSGIDRDYDKAIRYANGEYCWLMTDDDLLRPGAVKRVLKALAEEPDLVVANAEIRNATLSDVLQDRRLAITEDRRYTPSEREKFFREAGDYLSFIGGVVIRRQLWLARDRSTYFGTLFVHFGVIFQHEPIGKAYVIAEPLIVIRYGNAMWTSRGFDIWMFKWPRLVWSFDDFSSDDKRAICPAEPWRNSRQLLYLRATGAYSFKEYAAFLSPRLHGGGRMRALLAAILPAKLANLLYVAYFTITDRADRMTWYELLRSRSASWLSRLIAKLLRRAEYDRWQRGIIAN